MASKEPWLAAVKVHRVPALGDPLGKQIFLQTPDDSSKQVPGGDQSQPWRSMTAAVRGPPKAPKRACLCARGGLHNADPAELG